MQGEKTVIAEGYTNDGLPWTVYRYNLRYANVFETAVGGQMTHFSTRDACYAHLENTGVCKFRRRMRGQTVEYDQIDERREGFDGAKPRGTGDLSGGDDVQ